MRADFANFEPRYVSPTLCSISVSFCVEERDSFVHGRIVKLLNMTPSSLRWRLVDRKPLKTWIHPSYRVILLGDACHPMLVSPVI